jgi:hypothetical protein
MGGAEGVPEFTSRKFIKMPLSPDDFVKELPIAIEALQPACPRCKCLLMKPFDYRGMEAIEVPCGYCQMDVLARFWRMQD